MSVRSPSRRKTLKYVVMAVLGLGAGVALGEVTGANRLVHAASPSGPDPVFSGTGIQFPSLTSDPSQLVGNMWYRSDLTAMKYSDGTNAHELAALDLAQTFKAAQTFSASGIIIEGAGTGVGTLTYADSSTSGTLTFPAVTDTLAVLGTAQIFTAAQTFNGGMIFNGAGSIAVTSTFIEGTGAGGSIFVNVPTGQEIVNTINGVRVTLTDINGLYPSTKDDTYILGTATWRWASVNSVLFNVYHASGDVNPSFQGGDQYLHLGPGGGTSLIAGAGIVFTPVSATSTSTLQNSLVEDLFGSYWNGSASVPYGFRLLSVQDSTTPTAHLSFNLNDNGTLTEMMKLDQTGALTLSGNGIVFDAAGSIAATSTFIEADGAGGNLLVNVPSGKGLILEVGGAAPQQLVPIFNNALQLQSSGANLGSQLRITPSGTSKGASVTIDLTSTVNQDILSLGGDGNGNFELNAEAAPLRFIDNSAEAFRITTTPDLQIPTALRMWTGSATSLTIAPSTGSLSKLMTLGGGTAPTTVSLTSGTAYTASTTQNTIITIGGGTVTAIAINGTTTGLIAGTFYLKASDTITVTFTTAPTALQMVA